VSGFVCGKGGVERSHVCGGEIVKMKAGMKEGLAEWIKVCPGEYIYRRWDFTTSIFTTQKSGFNFAPGRLLKHLMSLEEGMRISP